MNKTLKYLKENNRWAIVLVLIMLVIGGMILRKQRKNINELKEKYIVEVNLRKALNDSIHEYQNREGEWVSEKKTIQIKVSELEKISNELTTNQKKLLYNIKQLNKDKSIITAALIKANFVIDSMTHGGLVVVDTLNNTIDFVETNNKDIKYNFQAHNVIPFPREAMPSLLIKNLTLLNEQFIEFHWTNNKKEGYPIAFSVTNSNKYINVYDIDSYAIPEIKRDIKNPEGWEKIGVWFKRNGKIVKYVGSGLAIGIAGTYIIMK